MLKPANCLRLKFHHVINFAFVPKLALCKIWRKKKCKANGWEIWRIQTLMLVVMDKLKAHFRWNSTKQDVYRLRHN